MIEISNLSKRYKDVEALKSVSLSIDAGLIFGLVGPNGAGKSTLINILTGIVAPTSGSVAMMGYDLKRDAMEIKKRMGVLPEIPSLFDGLTATEHLTFIGRVYGLAEAECAKRTKELFDYFDLSAAADRLTSTLSQGMKKKLGFAAAIIHAPALVVLDEPFENVDPLSRVRMKDILEKMRGKGAHIVMTSHALAEVEGFCDEVAIIHCGELVFRTRTSDIRAGIGARVNEEAYSSLEEIFLNAVSSGDEEFLNKGLSWL